MVNGTHAYSHLSLQVPIKYFIVKYKNWEISIAGLYYYHTWCTCDNNLNPKSQITESLEMGKKRRGKSKTCFFSFNSGVFKYYFIMGKFMCAYVCVELKGNH